MSKKVKGAMVSTAVDTAITDTRNAVETAIDLSKDCPNGSWEGTLKRPSITRWTNEEDRETEVPA